MFPDISVRTLLVIQEAKRDKVMVPISLQEAEAAARRDLRGCVLDHNQNLAGGTHTAANTSGYLHCMLLPLLVVPGKQSWADKG